MQLSSPVTDIKGVGPSLATKFRAIGVRTIADLLTYYPRRYDDYSQLSAIGKIRPGVISVEAQITSATGRYVRRGMHITEAIASDKTGSIRLVWFNQPYRAAAIKPGQSYYISGDYQLRKGRFSVVNPSMELVSDFPVNTARIIPIYRETKGLKSTQIRTALMTVRQTITDLPEVLPVDIIRGYKLMAYDEAIKAIHFPESNEQLRSARRRLGFEEVFSLILASLMNRREIEAEQAPVVPFVANVAKTFVSELPFDLTNAQRRVVWDIYQDMARETPMNRLVEGDVGAGKTVVAAMAAAMVLHHGHQVALMAPTEILATQHATTLQQLLAPLGYGDKVGLLVGSLSAKQKSAVRSAVRNGDIRFIVGTNALIQDSVDMHELQLAIIDEQHRFGVEQRRKLQAKAGLVPHILSLTATPIPRSLALTVYGELDISILSQKPGGRQPIVTSIALTAQRDEVYQKAEREVDKGRQIFVVCPLVSDSEMLDITSAEAVYERLRKGPFKHRRVGLLHGRMSSEEKQHTMQAYVAHQLDVLVATTVIEVGVDVPNATVMIVENAERFGLSQIHQLRGRVGRSEHQGYCYLLTDTNPISTRLRALERTDDGFKLAELDLELRGPGAIYGLQQHGQLDLRLVQLSDTQLISDAQQAARQFADTENLLQYKELHERVNALRSVTNLT